MAELTEAQTRRQLIDQALAKAGWDPTQPTLVGQEIPVDGTDAQVWQQLQPKLRQLRQAGVPYNVQLPTGISDYVLYRPNGEILAVVEAKRTSVDPRVAQVQAEYYTTALAQRQSFTPFVFLTNGYDIYFWEVGIANKRLVSGFFTQADLENLLHVRHYGTLLSQAPINLKITDRAYQVEAIRRVCEAFERGKRKALLVMATGTGKTRTVMSLVELFLRTNQAQRILFVADRDDLVKQALTDGFQTFLPDEPCTRIYTGRIDQTQRLYVATLQTLSNCFAEFSPAFFDLLIFDEVHRSIFNKWNEVLQYFDARMVGLTATPADFIDRNTFLQFECDRAENGRVAPTFLYTYEEAIAEKYLVPFNLYLARTRFQRQGIRGVELSEEERNLLIEQGIDPDEIDFSGSDLEKKVSNRDTLRQQWEELMEVCLKDQSGQLPGKTIVFAMTQDHAFRLQEAFEEMYPQYPGLSQVITYKTDYKGSAITKFKRESLPRIAISVDMLDTGIDVPEVVNLVFMKPVQSRIKLEQMKGRGTRSHAACKQVAWLPEGRKEGFKIIDFWENDFAQVADKEVAQSLPVLVTLFNTRLTLLETYLQQQQRDEAQRVITDLRTQINQIPIDSFSVRRIYPEIQQAWSDGFWLYLTQNKLDFLRMQVGPQLRFAGAVDVEAATFISKVERLQLQLVTGRAITQTAQSIAEDVSRLPNFVFEDAQLAPLAHLCLAETALAAATPAQLAQVRAKLADQMKNRRERPNNFLILDLRDLIELRGYIILTKRNEKVFVEEYRRRVDDRILDLVVNHPTIQAIEAGQAVSDQQLLALERTLRRELGGGDLELDEQNVWRAYGKKVDSLLAFLRYRFELNELPDYQEIVQREFDHYIAAQQFTGDQVRFLRAVQSVLLRKRRLRLADLYASPLTRFGQEAVQRFFTEAQTTAMITFLDSLAVAE